MNNLIITYKPIGKTPLEVVQEIKKKNRNFKAKRIAYAGRLDPMAEGLLLLLVEPETKNRDKYQNLDKVYEFEVLFGLGTDSHDILGIPEAAKNQETFSRIEIVKALNKFLGQTKQQYPVYSSKTVKGKPLYWWAKNKRLNEIKLPERYINVHKISLVKMHEISKSELGKLIGHRISLVKGNFRQEEILLKWKELLESSTLKKYQIAKIKVSCSTGTYVRKLCDDLGKVLDTKALAFSIKRVQIGEYSIGDVTF